MRDTLPELKAAIIDLATAIGMVRAAQNQTMDCVVNVLGLLGEHLEALRALGQDQEGGPAQRERMK